MRSGRDNLSCLCVRAAQGGEEQYVDQRHQRPQTSVRTRRGGGSGGGPLQEKLHHLRTWTHLREDVDTRARTHQHVLLWWETKPLRRLMPTAVFYFMDFYWYLLIKQIPINYKGPKSPVWHLKIPYCVNDQYNYNFSTFFRKTFWGGFHF